MMIKELVIKMDGANTGILRRGNCQEAMRHSYRVGIASRPIRSRERFWMHAWCHAPRVSRDYTRLDPKVTVMDDIIGIRRTSVSFIIFKDRVCHSDATPMHSDKSHTRGTDKKATTMEKPCLNAVQS